MLHRFWMCICIYWTFFYVVFSHQRGVLSYHSNQYADFVISAEKKTWTLWALHVLHNLENDSANSVNRKKINCTRLWQQYRYLCFRVCLIYICFLFKYSNIYLVASHVFNSEGVKRIHYLKLLYVGLLNTLRWFCNKIFLINFEEKLMDKFLLCKFIFWLEGVKLENIASKTIFSRTCMD